MTEYSDEFRQFVQDLFDHTNRQQPPPEDVVPPEVRPIDRAELLRRNEQTSWHEATIPGEIITDAEGVPIGITPSEKVIGHRSFAVTSKQLEAAGLTPDEVPNLRIINLTPRP